MWYVAILIGLGLLGALPFLVERTRAVIGPSARHGADGDFAQLSQGVTHFRWVGPTRGPVAVFVHGLTTPSIGMQSVADGLAANGYRVLLYDLYGRGLSDAVPGRQNRAFFLRQLTDLLAHQEIDEEITFVGYSMGGSIAVAFAVENAHRIKRVIMLAGAGVKVNESGFSRFCRKTPLLGDWMHAMFAGLRLRGAIPKKSKKQSIQQVQVAQGQELNRRGYLPAVLSSRRGILAENQEDDHRMLGREDVPVIAIWGERDNIAPIAALGILAQWNRGARQEVVEQADHGLPYTHDEQLIAAINRAMRD